ncbi:hypothetical protein ANANG_G00098510 [Anguilla anguilla]|uniref:Uncharacterized protein n=1 Tax=Anguilla anguilla TaxID=7936 RepID=A0A9D3RZ06_ANGAN|nr:hypothetical protein ANANG_G00098510 [Anguilla anguilla]
MNVSVERCALVSGLQTFDHLTTVNNNNDDDDDSLLADPGVVVVTDLERERDPPKTLVLDTPPPSGSSGRGRDPRSAWDYRMSSPQKEEEEDTSTVSSTTCDTPLPLDTPVSNRKPIFYIMDFTETDCSVTLDLSEIDNSPNRREGDESHMTLEANGRSNQNDPGSLSYNLESGSASETSASQSESTNEPPESKSAFTDEQPDSASHVAVSVCPSSADAEQAASDSCDAPEDKPEAAPADGSRPAHVKTKMASKNPAAGRTVAAGRPPRQRASAENQSMRKVVPLAKLSRPGSGARRVDRPPARAPSPGARCGPERPRQAGERTAAPPATPASPGGVQGPEAERWWRWLLWRRRRRRCLPLGAGSNPAQTDRLEAQCQAPEERPQGPPGGEDVSLHPEGSGAGGGGGGGGL